MTIRMLARATRLTLLSLAVVSVGAACWSTTDPGTGPVGGKTIVYGRVVGEDGAGLANTRVTVRHHTTLCAGRINESEAVTTNAEGRYRMVFTARTEIGCLSALAQSIGGVALRPDSVMNVRAPFRQTEPLDSIAVNLTLRSGGIQ